MPVKKRDSTHFVNADFLEAILQDFEIADVLMFQSSGEFHSLHGN